METRLKLFVNGKWTEVLATYDTLRYPFEFEFNGGMFRYLAYHRTIDHPDTYTLLASKVDSVLVIDINQIIEHIRIEHDLKHAIEHARQRLQMIRTPADPQNLIDYLHRVNNEFESLHEKAFGLTIAVHWIWALSEVLRARNADGDHAIKARVFSFLP